jgi:hypothetical protein
VKPEFVSSGGLFLVQISWEVDKGAENFCAWGIFGCLICEIKLATISYVVVALICLGFRPHSGNHAQLRNSG